MQLAIDTTSSHDASSTRNDADVIRHPLRSQNATHCGRMEEPQWACVHTHPQAEHWANSNLRQRGYETWLPLVPIRRRDRAVRTMWHTVQVPAFSRYVLLLHQPGSPWTPIRYAEGVDDLVRMGAEPAYASREAIEAVRKALETSLHTDGVVREGFRPGQALRWSAGALNGCDAIALRNDGNGRTRISIVMLGALREITACNHQLIPRD